jgi:hypothetical protein
MIAGVHLEFLAQSSLRVSVFVQWVWTYVTGQRGSQIILNSRPSDKEHAFATMLHPDAEGTPARRAFGPGAGSGVSDWHTQIRGCEQVCRPNGGQTCDGPCRRRACRRLELVCRGINLVSFALIITTVIGLRCFAHVTPDAFQLNGRSRLKYE